MAPTDCSRAILSAAYTVKYCLQGLLTATQLVMNSWKQGAFRSRQRAELGIVAKRKGLPTSTIPMMRTRADAPLNPTTSKQLKGYSDKRC
jgi:hypothetical protein